MPVIGKSLASGLLTTVTGNLYAVPAATIGHVTLIQLANLSNSSARSVNIFVKRDGATAVQIIGQDKVINASDELSIAPPEAFRLSANDVIQGNASANSAVNYFICGGEQ